tara:strand:+ start:468 stop:686 length:219 start_codon:yes stop_codon:yes gene_type:complete
MKIINSINISLNDKRKLLLITLNIVLAIFIILEIMIWNQINGLMTKEEYQEARQEFCRKQSMTNSMSCRKPS